MTNYNNPQRPRIYFGIGDVIQIVLIVLKLCGAIDWSWWLVLLPLLLGVSIYLIFYIALEVRRRR